VEPGETAGQAVPAPGPDPRADLEAFLDDHYWYFLRGPMAIGATLDDAYEAVQATVADMLAKDTWSQLTRKSQGLGSQSRPARLLRPAEKAPAS
jgi:hypothetical protein